MNKIVTLGVTVLFSLCVFLAEIDNDTQTAVFCNAIGENQDTTFKYDDAKAEEVTPWFFIDTDVFNPTRAKEVKINNTICIKIQVYKGSAI